MKLCPPPSQNSNVINFGKIKIQYLLEYDEVTIVRFLVKCYAVLHFLSV